MPPADRHPFRAPPSSQPVMPSRASSAFPSLQRPRPRPPPPPFTQGTQRQTTTFRTPSSSQARPQAQAQAQSQRPSVNMNLDNRYSPPPSQPSQLFASQLPQSQSQSQSQRQRPRPPPPPPRSSQGEYPLESVDHYRPGSAVPRSAVDVYQTERPSVSGSGLVTPKAQKGAEILEKIASLHAYLEEKITKKEEEDEEFQGAIEDRLKGLEDENKDLKERLHELSMGQKVLPTKEELNEEITNQLSPALHEFFEGLDETLKKGLESVPEQTAGLAAGKVKGDMLEMQDLARKEAMKEGAVENPLMTLLNHLITKLGPLDDITTTLASLSGLPEALEQVAVFRNTMEAMQIRIANRPTQPQAQAPIEAGAGARIPPVDLSSTNQITQLMEAVEGVRKKIETPPTLSVGLDSGKVFGAITGLKRTLEDLKTSIAAGQGQSQGRGHGVEIRNAEDAENVIKDKDMKEMKDLILGMKAEMTALKASMVNHTSAPIPEPAPVIDGETVSTLRAILDQLKERPLPTIQPPTPKTGVRPVTAERELLPISEGPASQESPPRIFNRVIRPTAKARQDSGTMRALEKRHTQPISEGAGAGGAQVIDTFGVVQPIPSGITTVAGAHKKRKTKATKTTLGSAVPNNTTPDKDVSQGTSSRNTSTGSVADKGKKRKTPPGDSLGMKQEALEGLKMNMDRPMTRADSTRAKAVGIDIIEIGSSSEGSKPGNKRSGSSTGKKKTTPPQSTSTSTAFPTHPWTLPPLSTTDNFESLPLPESQVPESQLPFPESRLEPTQHNNSQTDTMMDYGHGQLPSIPSLPGYESTEGYTDTYVTPRPDYEDVEEENREAVRSTEQVEESLMVPAEKAKRAEPGYRKYQKPGQPGHGQEPKTYGNNTKLFGFMKGRMALLDESDDE